MGMISSSNNVTATSIQDILENFLKSFKDTDGSYKYRQQIEAMSARQARSLVVDYNDLALYNQDIILKLHEEPIITLEEFSRAVYSVLKDSDAKYAEKVKDEISVRISNYPYEVKMRDIDADMIGKLISTTGMVVRASEVKPFITMLYYRCGKGHEDYIAREEYVKRKGSASKVLCPKCNEEEIYIDVEKSRFSNIQMIRMQELPEDLPPGQLPYHIDVILMHDLVDNARPGDRIMLTGIVRVEKDMESKSLDLPLYRIKIVANNIEFIMNRQKDDGRGDGRLTITEDDEREIRRLASKENIYELLINSFAPHIFGHEIIKEAILLQIVGSPAKVLEDGTKLRGDINILLVGDPGTAKSELLKYAARIAPRGLYTSGRGSTAAGLTAAVVRDKSGMMMLEAGAVVLGDQGLVCVTEDTEIYTGNALTPIKQLWDMITSPIYITRTGREAKRCIIPVGVYDGKSRVDIGYYAFAIMRKRYTGDIIRLTFASGLTLEVTPEHLLMYATDVKNLWKPAKDIRPGDLLKSPVRVIKPVYTLDVEPDEAYVIGCVYCNGHITPYDITISQANKNADDDVVSMIQARMPGIFSLYDNGERVRELGKYMLLSRVYQLWTSDKRFVQKVHFLLKSPSIDNILLLSDDSLWAFIAGVFDADGDFKHSKGKVYAARLYPAIDEHEVRVMIYALRRLGVYARINKRRKDEVQVIQITGEDLLRFVEGIKKYSVKAKHEIASTNNSNSIVTNNKSVKRGVERVIKVERVPYDGYVYDLSVGEYHNYEVSLVYVHNCIDELDKMRQEDRSALHEVMEQQTCSVAKGGIVATLNARTSILAAANPILGKYDPYRNITENINLPIPLLTRFDLIFAIRDEPNKDADAQLARHILGIHRRAGYERLPYINIDMLRKYLAYAKRVNPVLSREAEDKIFEYYMQMRASASPDAITITARQLEALIRLATARARLLLKSIVDVSDAERAIHIFNVMLNKVGIDVKTGKVDLGVLHGMPQSERSKMKLFLDIFNALSGKDQNPVEEQALITELVKTGKFTEDDAKEWINKAKLNGMIYEVRQGFYKRT